MSKVKVLTEWECPSCKGTPCFDSKAFHEHTEKVHNVRVHMGNSTQRMLRYTTEDASSQIVYEVKVGEHTFLQKVILNQS
jgi:hypothetical protein